MKYNIYIFSSKKFKNSKSSGKLGHISRFNRNKSQRLGSMFQINQPKKRMTRGFKQEIRAQGGNTLSTLNLELSENVASTTGYTTQLRGEVPNYATQNKELKSLKERGSQRKSKKQVVSSIRKLLMENKDTARSKLFRKEELHIVGEGDEYPTNPLHIELENHRYIYIYILLLILLLGKEHLSSSKIRNQSRPLYI